MLNHKLADKLPLGTYQWKTLSGESHCTLDAEGKEAALTISICDADQFACNSGHCIDLM